MIVARKEIALALLVFTYGILATYGKYFSERLSDAFGGNPEITPHDIWACLVLFVFVMSSFYVRLTADNTSARDQLLTFLTSLGLVIGIAISTSRYITLYFAFSVYFFFFLPIFAFDTKYSDPKKGESLLFSFLVYCVAMSFVAACFGFILQRASLLVMGDMRSFGLAPPAISLVIYQIMIANGHLISGLKVEPPFLKKLKWKYFAYGSAAVLNGLYGLLWLGNSISLESFGKFVSHHTKEYATFIVSAVSFTLVFAFSVGIFYLFESLRNKLKSEDTMSLVPVSLSKYDVLAFLAAGLSLGTALALLAITGIGYSSIIEQQQIYRQIHLIWVNGILGGLIVFSLVLAEKTRRIFI